MYRYLVQKIYYLVLFCLCSNLYGQEGYLLITAIEIQGNKRTKDKVILRELDISVGDTVYLMNKEVQLNTNRKRLLDTGLFTNMELDYAVKDSNQAILTIKAQENWFIYPRPIFDLADRNFNVWWSEQNRSLQRVNYGIRISHINLTGNKDPLKMVFQFGYTRNYQLIYAFPYLDKKQNLGLAAYSFYSEQKEIGYKTIANKTVFDRFNDDIVLRRFRTGLRLNYHHGLVQYHTINLEFHHNRIHDFIAKDLNPDYFLEEKNNLRFFYLEYDFKLDRRIFHLFPERGYFLQMNIKKEGLGIFNDYSNLSSFFTIENYFRPHQRWILGTSLKVKANIFRRKVGFGNNTGLGYDDNIIKGYELYVVDGTDYMLFKTGLHFRLLNTNLNFKKWMPLPHFRKMNLQIYLSANYGAGYVNEPTYKATNSFSNRLLNGYGLGLNIIYYHIFLWQIEYSFNHLGEAGLFLKNKVSF